ncbi:MAG: hypothetical protein KF901_01155 [Myxococcales bacterium]|nr:hypothetical protein [Myxococcales bacterium]
MLTAAALHEAGHQQPMAFQVITVGLGRERDIEVGRVRIDFHMSSVFDGAATQPMQTETGTMVATPETTAFDPCASRPQRGTGATSRSPSSELAEKLDLEALRHRRRAHGEDGRAAPRLAPRLRGAVGPAEPPPPRSRASACCRFPLTGPASRRTPSRPRWHVLVNDDVEPDL